MSIRIADRSSKDDRWLLAYINGQAELGAHFAPRGTPTDRLITIYWSGCLTVGGFARTVSMLSESPQIDPLRSATVTSFGADRRVFKGDRTSLRDFLSGGSLIDLTDYKAFRAELHGRWGRVVAWGSVGHGRRNLERAEQNVGIAVSPNLLSGSIRFAIEHWIYRSTGIVPPVADLAIQMMHDILEERAMIDTYVA